MKKHRDDDLDLQLQPVVPDGEYRVPHPQEDLPSEGVVEVLRVARRDGEHFAGRKYRTNLLRLVGLWRARNTPEFFVAAQELEDALRSLREGEPERLPTDGT